MPGRLRKAAMGSACVLALGLSFVGLGRAASRRRTIQSCP